MSQDRADWELRQARTFEKWCNIYLKRAQKGTIEDGTLDSTFQDGVKLIDLLDALYRGTEFEQKIPKHKRTPQTQIHRRNNLSQAIKMYEGVGIRRVGWTEGQIEEGAWGMTLGMVWCVILHANVSLIAEDNSAGKQGLLLWCQKQCRGYKGIDGYPKNFTKNWKDGRIFNALLHRYYPDRVDFDSLSADNAAENIEHAFANFEEIGVDRLIMVEDMLVEKPDEKQVMCYVSELFKLLSKQDFKGKATEHIMNFLNFNRRIQGLCDQYEEGAKNYMGFVEQSVETWAAHPLAETKQGAAEDINNYKKWITTDLPPQQCTMIDLQTLYANVQSELNANGRLPWDCPNEISPEALEGANEKMAAAQGAYFTKMKEHQFSFIHADDGFEVDEKLIDEIKKAFDYFDKDESGHLCQDEFFAAMAAVGVCIPEDQQYKTFSGIAGADGHINKPEYVKYMTSYYDTSDTAAAIMASASKLGDASNFDAAAAGLRGEDAEFLTSVLENGDFDAYVKSLFKPEE